MFLQSVGHVWLRTSSKLNLTKACDALFKPLSRTETFCNVVEISCKI